MQPLCPIYYLLPLVALSWPNDFMTSPTTMMEAKATPIASETTPTPAVFGQTEQVLPANASTPPEFATTELDYNGEVTDNCYLDFCYDNPVCGSDCITYASYCHLGYAACKQGIQIRALHEGDCSNKTATKIIDFPSKISVLKMESVELSCQTDNDVAIETIRWYEAIDEYGLEIRSGSPVLKLSNIVNTRIIYCSILSCDKVVESNKVSITVDESVCMLQGTGHILTFNQNHYFHKSECTYLASRDSTDFKWMVYTEFKDSWQIPSPALTTVTLYYDRLALELRRGWQYNLFGQERYLKSGEKEIHDNNVEVAFDGLYLTITAPGLQLIWDGIGTLAIIIPKETKTSGLCGSNSPYGADLVPKHSNRYYRSSNLIEDTDGDIDSFVRSWAQNIKRCARQGIRAVHPNTGQTFCSQPQLPFTSIKIDNYFQESCQIDNQDTTLILGDTPIRCWYVFGKHLLQDYRRKQRQNEDATEDSPEDRHCTISRLQRQYIAYFSDSQNAKPPFLP